MKRWMIVSAVVAAVGALTTVVFLIAMGVDYRAQEATGVEPGYTPEVVAGGFYAGLWLLGVGIVALIVCGIVAATHRRGRSAAPSPSEP